MIERKNKIGCVIAYTENHNNYGTSLQGYATIKKIQDLGYECEIIRYNKHISFFEKLRLVYLMFRCGGTMDKMRVVKEKLNLRRYPEYAKGILERTKAVNAYKAKRLIPLFHMYNGYAELHEGSKNYDAVLVGSDQVWTPMSLYSKYYNLLFADDEVRKIAYASSFGVSVIPKFQWKATGAYLDRFYQIGVRETRGKEIVETLSNKKATVVADPTMLLSPKEWEKEIKDSKVHIENPYIFCYFLGTNPEARAAANKLKERTGYKIVTIRHMDEFVPNDETFGDEAPYMVDPNDFVKYISEASFVLTDSFHCSVFSILFQRKFMTFYRFKSSNKGSRNSRIDSLLGLFNLRSRLYTGDVLSIQNEINYISVHKVLDEYRQQSLDFLKQALEG